MMGNIQTLGRPQDAGHCVGQDFSDNFKTLRDVRTGG